MLNIGDCADNVGQYSFFNVVINSLRGVQNICGTYPSNTFAITVNAFLFFMVGYIISLLLTLTILPLKMNNNEHNHV